MKSPQEAVERRIIKLQAVQESEDFWNDVVKGVDPDNCCTNTDVIEI